MKYVIYLGLIFLVGCSSLDNPASETASIELLDERTLRFSGQTSLHNASAFEALFANNAERIDTLRISSGGGDVFGGMAMGRLVHEHQLKVIVENICASSCANYVVTASPDVLVTENALLGWHGGSTQPLYTPLVSSTPWLVRVGMFLTGKNYDAQVSEYTERWQVEEREFFERIGVEQVVTVLGMMPGLVEERDAPLFSYDVATLKQLGLKVQFEGEQAETLESGDKVVQIFHLDEAALRQFIILHNKTLEQANQEVADQTS